MSNINDEYKRLQEEKAKNDPVFAARKAAFEKRNERNADKFEKTLISSDEIVTFDMDEVKISEEGKDYKLTPKTRDNIIEPSKPKLTKIAPEKKPGFLKRFFKGLFR